MKDLDHRTADDIDKLAASWLAVNKTTRAQVKHDLYPIGFVAALIEKLEKLGHNAIQPTARTFRHNDASVISEIERKRQDDLRRKTDHWACWKSDWKLAIENGRVPGEPMKPEMTHMPLPRGTKEKES